MTSTIVLRGGFGNGNLGDDLLLMSCAGELEKWGQRESARYLGKASRYVEDLIGIAPVSRQDLNGIVRMMYTGGTQFYSFESRALPVGKLKWYIKNIVKPRRLVRHWRKLALHKLVIETAASRAAFGIGFGPFEHERHRRKAVRKLSGCEIIYARDEKCLGVLGSRLENVPVRLGADLTFRLRDRFEGWRWEGRRGRVVVGCIPRYWPHGREGAEKQASRFNEVRRVCGEKGWEVAEFHFQETDRRWRGGRLGQVGPHVWKPARMSVEEYVGRLARCDVLVSSRLHGVIVGAMLSVPTLAVEIERKLMIARERHGYIWNERSALKGASLSAQLGALVAAAGTGRYAEWNASLVQEEGRRCDEMYEAMRRWMDGGTE